MILGIGGISPCSSRANRRPVSNFVDMRAVLVVPSPMANSPQARNQLMNRSRRASRILASLTIGSLRLERHARARRSEQGVAHQHSVRGTLGPRRRCHVCRPLGSRVALQRVEVPVSPRPDCAAQPARPGLQPYFGGRNAIRSQGRWPSMPL